jgi:DNA-directed RNA polymerase subunit F
MTRNGKIARLSRPIRDELCRRLQDGEPGVRLVAWLNGLPDTQRVLATDFGGRPINEQNLCDWKAGGYRDWLARQETLSQARELAADAKELTAATDGRLTDHLATVLAARYAAALAGWDGEVTEEFRRKLRTLRSLCQDIVELRRGDHSGARLNMEQERLEREREKTEEEVVEHFKRWVKKPEVRDWICQDWVSPEERESRLCAIFDLEPKTPDEVPTDGQESNPGNGQEPGSIKPDQTESR